MPKKKETKKIKTSELFAEFPNLYEVASEDDMTATFNFAEEYKAFLDNSKTEREFAANAIAAAEDLGYVDIATKDTLNPGDKVYQSIKGKGSAAAVIGKKSPAEGFNILGAHIDSPRLDLKPNPIYEDNDTVYFKTHYYGGIKKYQWTTIPLAVHGVVFTNDGKAHQIVVGEKDTDPVFYITDLLPHLGNEQMTKKASEFIPAEDLNVIIGGIPCTDDKKSSDIFKAGVLKLLFEQYGIKEKDFVSAEIEIVPATHARDVGFDRAYIAAYGHDDKVCAYPALRALLAQEKPKKTCVCLLTDKEEIGSYSNSGATSNLYENFLMEVFAKAEGGIDKFNTLKFRKALAATKMLSTDVTTAYDPSTLQYLRRTIQHSCPTVLRSRSIQVQEVSPDAPKLQAISLLRSLISSKRIPSRGRLANSAVSMQAAAELSLQSWLNSVWTLSIWVFPYGLCMLP